MAAEDTEGPSYPIASVGNALRILLMLRDNDVVTVSSCARALQVAPSTAHRLLSMLVHFDFVRKESAGRGYRAGPALLGLGLSALYNLDVRRDARPHLEALAAEVDETVNLMSLDLTWVRFLDCVEGTQALRIASRIGLRRPAAHTSVGKALLSQLSPERLDALYPRDRPIPAMTSKSIIDRAQLDDELAEIRARGYATNFGQTDLDIAALGMAVRTAEGLPLIGIAVSVPSTRMSEQRVPQLTAAMRRSVQRLEQDLRSHASK